MAEDTSEIHGIVEINVSTEVPDGATEEQKKNALYDEASMEMHPDFGDCTIVADYTEGE